MNSVIKRELEKIRAPLPEYDDNTTIIDIPRSGCRNPVLRVGGMYLIEVADYVLHEPPNFTLSSNWNKGVIPTSKALSVSVVEITGKMVQVTGNGYDLETNTMRPDHYTGLWLPQASISIIDECKW